MSKFWCDHKDIIKRKTIQYLTIAFGVILLDIGHYFFMNPNGLVMGGMMGLSIIFNGLYSKLGSWFTPSIFMLIGNIIALIIGGLLLGKDFFFKTIFSTIFSPLVIFLFERLHFNPEFFIQNITENKIIISLICGCLLEGIGLGIALKNNGSTGGLDVVQKVMSRYLHIPYSKTMYLTDWVIVFFSGFVFNPFSFRIEKVVYGILGVLAISILIDRIVLNVRSRRTAYIITEKSEEIKQMIYAKIDRGVTLVNAEGGYTGEIRKMVICTMEKSEAYKIMEILKEIDPHAFCYISSTSEIVGEYLNNVSRKS